MGVIDPRVQAGDFVFVISKVRVQTVYDDSEGEPEVLTDSQGNEYHRDDVDIVFLAED